MVDAWLRYVQLLLYPPTCLLCGAPGTGGRDICAGCLSDLPENARACRRCAMPLPSSEEEGTTCGRCLARPPPFDRAFARFLYRGAIPYLVQQIKFRSNLSACHLLGDLLTDGIARRTDRLPEWVVPVPLHRNRQRTRGFNQALELARAVAAGLQIPLAPRACARIRPTQTQASLDADQRGGNVRGAFAVREWPGGSHVAIVDDVITTASTVGEVARVLRQAGAKRIEVWACARAVGSRADGGRCET